jgi:hypothetical protein
VHDARAAAHGAVFGVRLPLAPAEIDAKLVGLSAEWTFDDGGGATFGLGHGPWSMAQRQVHEKSSMRQPCWQLLADSVTLVLLFGESANGARLSALLVCLPSKSVQRTV